MKALMFLRETELNKTYSKGIRIFQDAFGDELAEKIDGSQLWCAMLIRATSQRFVLTSRKVGLKKMSNLQSSWTQKKNPVR